MLSQIDVYMMCCFVSSISFKNLSHACKMPKIVYPENKNKDTVEKIYKINLVGFGQGQGRQLPKAAGCQKRRVFWGWWSLSVPAGCCKQQKVPASPSSPLHKGSHTQSSSKGIFSLVDPYTSRPSPFQPLPLPSRGESSKTPVGHPYESKIPFCLPCWNALSQPFTWCMLTVCLDWGCQGQVISVLEKKTKFLQKAINLDRNQDLVIIL